MIDSTLLALSLSNFSAVRDAAKRKRDFPLSRLAASFFGSCPVPESTVFLRIPG